MKLKDRLIQLRKENKMTQADLANTLNISRQAISRWETGAAIPSIENLVELSKLYGISVDAILDNGGIEGKPKEESTNEKLEEQRQQRKPWQNKQLMVIILALVVLLIIIITVAVGAVVGITKSAREQGLISIEDMNEDGYVSPEKVEINDIQA